MEVSIVIPTYNHGNYVAETLAAVFAQTFTDYEVIVVNDGSPDDTADVLRPLADTGRIRYIEQANQGQAAARNRGLAEAQGEFIAFLDDDDLWPTDKLDWQVKLMRENPDATLIYGYSSFLNNGSRTSVPTENAPTGRVRDAFLLSNSILSPGQTLIRRQALNAVGGYDSQIWGADDWDLWLRLAEKGPFAYQHRCGLFYRQHQTNASHDLWRMYINAQKVLDKNLGVYPKMFNIGCWLRCRRNLAVDYSRLMRQYARELSSSGQPNAARRVFLQAVWIRPASLRRYSVLHELSLLMPHKY